MSLRISPAGTFLGATWVLFRFIAIVDPRPARPKTRAIDRPMTPIPLVHRAHPIAVTFDLLLLAGDRPGLPKPHGSSSSWPPRPGARFLPSIAADEGYIYSEASLGAG